MVMRATAASGKTVKPDAKMQTGIVTRTVPVLSVIFSSSAQAYS
jgi:hypothetical protein